MTTATYERHREQTRQRAATVSRSGRDIGPPPKRRNTRRWRKTRNSLRAFLESYFPAAFPLAWSDDHLQVIEAIQTAVIDGGLFALAMPRGSGKTTICERAALWAILTGRRPFVCLVGASEDRAQQILTSIKTELTYNEQLHEDYGPECHGFPELEGDAKRCIGQLCAGVRTGIEYGAKRIVFGDNRVTKCGGSIVTVCGITGAIRGQKHTQRDGTVIRPSLVLIDDPQTKESAMSPSQSARRAEIIAGDVLGMAGPGKSVAAVMPMTVIAPDDMADQLLDREKHPRWRGVRTKLLNSLPKRMDLWEQYRDLQEQDARNETQTATAFYEDNREAMDQGAQAAWTDRFNPDAGEVSAIQHAMNLYFRDFNAFMAEYQNEPQRPDISDIPLPTTDEVAERVSGYERRVVPDAADHVVAFIDVGETLLHYTVAAFSDQFDGWVIDYGCEPEQRAKSFSTRQVRRNLSVKYGGSKEEYVAAGLAALSERLMSHEWIYESGGVTRISRLFIDAGHMPHIVAGVCRRSSYSALMTPTRGYGTTAIKRPISEWNKQGRRFQPGPDARWVIQRATKRKIGELQFDTNFWKTFLFSRLSVPHGGKGGLWLFGKKPSDHGMYAEHVTAEVPKRDNRGRVVDVWRLLPARENHFLDTLVGCCVAASFEGAVLSIPAATPSEPTKRKRVTFSEMQRKAREGRR